MQSKIPKKTDQIDGSIKTNSKQKKPYRKPEMKPLTPEQARVALIEKALPGEAATSQLLAASSRSGPLGRKEEHSIPSKAKGASEK
jgi:hypothetical protein